uniref:Major facilitator superfamily (MFS) profile domain-containing protein n=4 Tax=Clastoptera arizonana TaxID=38151 RepID=A0A1B6CS07_9HEMI
MMVIGLVISSGSLVVLGPSPFLAKEPYNLSVVLLSLSVLSMATSLTMMPTFQGLLDCAVRSGKSREVATYSLVAGTWASMYSLGDMIGPILGGLLLDRFGFPILSTVMAIITLTVASIAFVFFLFRDKCTNYNKKLHNSKTNLLNGGNCIYYGGSSSKCVITEDYSLSETSSSLQA